MIKNKIIGDLLLWQENRRTQEHLFKVNSVSGLQLERNKRGKATIPNHFTSFFQNKRLLNIIPSKYKNGYSNSNGRCCH